MRLTIQLDLTRNLRYFHRLLKATEQRSNGFAVIHRNYWIQAEKGGFTVLFYVNMTNHTLYCIVIYCIDSSSIKYLPSYTCIQHNWMFLNKQKTTQVLRLNDMMIYNTDISEHPDLDLYFIYIKRLHANLLYVFPRRRNQLI